ncbi:GntR family transcriptional regulator [Collinsella sp. AGMB00827]|uniref:GntR family transcriptional regulator n=1 Tax=Collinsella ureilytica TaxID=2869515 RepID=A0ABS7MK17_9ACTN|nr:GntR family transcriptional regulator [Collinsella urealyticum]MBY4797709.1 GntR family transcriptional regulator [Collinsella urealyticum]
MLELDFNGKKRLYAQLYDILYQEIAQGTYGIGDLIPSETELMKTFNISRATARKSMEMLANNGLIRKRRGHGSEVIADRPNMIPRKVSSYVRKNPGVPEPDTCVQMDACVIPADEEISAQLDLAEGTELFSLRLLHGTKDEPYYVEDITAELAYVPAAPDRDFEQLSWRDFLTDECQVRWSRVCQRVIAVAASEEQAGILGVPPGFPLMQAECILYDIDKVPREVVRAVYRSDLYQVAIEIEA